jgi:hypothetical protein
MQSPFCIWLTRAGRHLSVRFANGIWLRGLPPNRAATWSRCRATCSIGWRRCAGPGESYSDVIIRVARGPRERALGSSRAAHFAARAVIQVTALRGACF